jgi:hypothetical protein
MHLQKLLKTATSKYLEKWKLFEFFKGLPLDKLEEFSIFKIFEFSSFFTICLVDYNLNTILYNTTHCRLQFEHNSV